MESTTRDNLLNKLRDILLFVRWGCLERVNPFKSRKIFVIGLSKTGTTSLHDAFSILGIKSIHYPKVYNLKVNYLRFSWHWRFEPIQAFSDIPVVAFLDDLLLRYPKSYVILTKRQKTSWLNSCEKHFNLPAINPIGKALRNRVYGTDVFDYNSFSSTYDQHTEYVCNKFKNHPRFIEIALEQEDKWGPLCKLLNLPIPSLAYPHSNRSDG